MSAGGLEDSLGKLEGQLWEYLWKWTMPLFLAYGMVKWC